VEGCMGVGKTTVTALLGSSMHDSHLVLEDFSKCPFLDDFYGDSFLYSFETEINFLLIHYHQLFKAMNTGHDLIISDYFFDREKIFADVNISDEKEMLLFVQLFEHLRTRLICPDVVVCLSGTTDMIYNRILNRGRENEKNISYDYIQKINSHYEKFFASIRHEFFTITIDMDEFDFVKDPSLINIIKRSLANAPNQIYIL
jgi:deoxyadenosine/deoxycytidine kinase